MSCSSKKHEPCFACIEYKLKVDNHALKSKKAVSSQQQVAQYLQNNTI